MSDTSRQEDLNHLSIHLRSLSHTFFGSDPAGIQHDTTTEEPECDDLPAFADDYLMNEWLGVKVKKDAEETRHWILKGERTTLDHPCLIRGENLIGFEQLQEVIDSKQSSDEKDKLLLKRSEGLYYGKTCLYWACWAVTNSPSNDKTARRIVKHLMETISAKRRKEFTDSIRSNLNEYPLDIIYYVLDSYDGDVIELSASCLMLRALSDDVYHTVLKILEEKYQNVEQSIIQLCSVPSEFDKRMTLLHDLTAQRRNYALYLMLSRLSHQCRQKLLTKSCVECDVTPLYLSRATSDDVERKLPGDYHFLVDDVDEDLIRMFNLFCNSYSVTHGVNLMSWTVDSTGDNSCMYAHVSHHTYKPYERFNETNFIVIIFTKHIDDARSLEAVELPNVVDDIRLWYNNPDVVVFVQYVVKAIPDALEALNASLDASLDAVLDGSLEPNLGAVLDAALYAAREESADYNADSVLDTALDAAIESILGAVLNVAFEAFLNAAQDNPLDAVLDRKMTIANPPANVLYGFLLTVSDLSPFLKEILEESGDSISMAQKLRVTKYDLQLHESVVYVSNISHPSTNDEDLLDTPRSAVIVSCDLLPLNAINSGTIYDEDDDKSSRYDDASDYDNEVDNDEDMRFQASRALKTNFGNLPVAFLNIHIDTVDSAIPQPIILPDLRVKKGEVTPEIVFLQLLVAKPPQDHPTSDALEDKVRKALKEEEAKLRKKKKHLVDHCWWFVYTSTDVRGEVLKYLNGCNTISVQEKLSLLRQNLTALPGVLCVSALYSTLGRNLYLSNEQINTEEDTFAAAPKRNGSALIICIKSGRENWKDEHDNACDFVEQLTGQKPETHYDLKKTDIIKVVQDFSLRNKYDQYSILVLMCHGDEMDNLIAADERPIPVKDVTDSFSKHSSHPMVVILQYCRGPMTDNKLPDTFEEKLLPPSPQQATPRDSRSRAGKNRSAVLPKNLYMVYSTLSDSRSYRGLMFNCMKDVLQDKKANLSQLNSVNVIQLITDVAGRVREKSKLQQHIETVDKLTEPLYLPIHAVG